MVRSGKRSSLQDVARAAGVDVSTVSLVLNHKPLAERLRAETRERIQVCARMLDYRPSRTARALKTGKTGMIGMVVGDISSLFYSELTATALRIAEKHGRQLLIAATEWSPEKERRALKSLLDVGADGIIFLPGSLLEHAEQVETIRREKLPVVTYDCRVPGMGAVFCDYAPGMAGAVGALVARHASIGCLLNGADHSDKAGPFLEACRRFGCRGMVRHHRGNDFADFAREIDVASLVAPGMPRAWIIGGCEIAVHVLTRLSACGIRLPEEAEVIGLGGGRLRDFTQPSLALLRQDPAGLMEAAFQLLDGSGGEIRVPTDFLPGGSVLSNSVSAII